jgi:hypothetical protein
MTINGRKLHSIVADRQRRFFDVRVGNQYRTVRRNGSSDWRFFFDVGLGSGFRFIPCRKYPAVKE